MTRAPDVKEKGKEGESSRGILSNEETRVGAKWSGSKATIAR